MARVMTKAEIMCLYKVRFGEKALLQSIHQSYIIKDYEKSILSYDTLYGLASDTEKKKIFRGLRDFEKEAIAVDFDY